jgi:hypothetical protein
MKRVFLALIFVGGVSGQVHALKSPFFVCILEGWLGLSLCMRSQANYCYIYRIYMQLDFVCVCVCVCLFNSLLFVLSQRECTLHHIHPCVHACMHTYIHTDIHAYRDN